ncbi:helicase protein MOM1-like [Abrus precatorius]|uniref:Helicase protein MOM1-like n=1 Tax=Abrus precatorius TaxID=3816 RepID=A0A8B8KBH3_ABRPR|nr:helicase protein MOM1-like [Abrus precatorius]
MASGTRSSQRAKYEENNNNGRVTRSGEKGKVKSHPNVSDTADLRRSPRVTSSKKIIPSPSRTQKSERLEKRTLPTPAAKRKSVRVDIKKMPSPLRRSGRTRSHSSSSPSDSKSSGSLSSEQKPKKEKSVRQLTFESKEVIENEEHDLGTSHVKVKRMDARTYRSLFQLPKKGNIVKMLASKNSILDEDTVRNGVGHDMCQKSVPSRSKGIMVDIDSNVSATLAEGDKCNLIPEGSPSMLDGNIMGIDGPSNAATDETGLVSKRVQPDCCGEETIHMLASRNFILDEDLSKNSVGPNRGEKSVPSKRKGITEDNYLDVSVTFAKPDNCNFIPDGGSSRLNGDVTRSCSKRIRLDYNPTVSESFKPSETELWDGNDADANMLQKDFPASLLADAAKNRCVICKREGQLLYCGGKECNGCYHLSCLEPPLLDAPLGVWHCHFCVRKKIDFGVYSVSKGIEAIFDVREYSSSNVNVQKEFLVKYIGLAHVHNRWVPENHLLLEDPLMLTKFNQKDQTLQLKPEWSLPHRLLQKRALIHGKQHDNHRNNYAVDYFEWHVKWRGLGYEHATWELDNASFLCSPEGKSLIRGYEGRFQRAKRISCCSKLDKKIDRGNSFNKLSQMPGGVSSGFRNNNLDAVNKLREHWHKGQNAMVIDDHDRILKVVAFILSLHSDTYQPFLIVSTDASLQLWEDEFYRLDPSIDVVIYNGNREIRNSIRRLEFYDEGHCILFQVLIVVPEILIEDMDVLGDIEWETIIVDECQSPKISSYFKQIKMLNTHLRVLLLYGQLKDNIDENINILALLDFQFDTEKEDGLISKSNNYVVQLKQRLSRHIVYRCKSDSFRFVEYWVPVQISHVQLEQYCAILLSNDSILRSSSKIDSVGAVRDVLISTRKCCSHPYVVDPDLQPFLNKGLEPVGLLDVGIKASGKLQLLDSMLMELKKNGLRVLILFQSIGGTGHSKIGDILDDVLRQRFGKDSYERIDKSLAQSKKQAAMKIFNDKNTGRFVFLLETCACLPSIKLSSIDAIIIFDSDWNPMNDIRSLQKITLDSQFELIKIFRLYSSFTVEEKALILAKQDKTLDINSQNLNWSTSHMLLMWGASCLFDELEVFHDGETSQSSLKSLFGRPLLKDAMHEFSSLLSLDGEDINITCSTLLKVKQKGGTYHANFPLLGEQKYRLLDEESPQFFWTKLLEGKQFQWKYINSSSQRNRKKVHPFDGLVDGSDLVSEGTAKKRRRVSNNIVDPPSSKYEGEKLSTGIKAGASGDIVDKSQGNDVESQQKCRQRDEQRGLHLLLKPEIRKLCDVLLLPENVKSVVDNFLEYVMNNHRVNRETVSILQAFRISLCWTAAALLKHKLAHGASLIRAKQHLNFDCKKQEADWVYSMLRCLKKIFLYRTGNYTDTSSPKASKSLSRAYSRTEAAREVELFLKDLSKSIKEIRKKCEGMLKNLCLVQEEEMQRLKAAFEDEKTDIERKYKIELAFIQSCSPTNIVRMEKLKILNIEYEKRNVELKCQHEKRFKDLEDKQLAEKQKLQVSEATWVEDLKSWAQNELLNLGASREVGTVVESLQACDQVLPHNGPKNNFAEGQGHDDMVDSVMKTGTVVPDTKSPAVLQCSSTTELQNPLVKQIGTNEMDNMVLEDQPISRSEDHNRASQGYIISKHSHSGEQNSFDDVRENSNHGSQDGCRNDAVTSILLSSNREVCNGETSDIATGEVAHDVFKSSSATDGQDKVHSLNSESPEKNIHGAKDSAQICVADKCEGSNNSVAENSPLSDERIANGAAASLLDRVELLGLHGTVNITDCPENGTAMNPSSSKEQISDGGTVNEFLDRESSRLCETASPGNSPVKITLLKSQPQNSGGVLSSIPDGHALVEVQETSYEGDTVSVLEREIPVATPVMFNYTDCPEDAAPLNSLSSMGQRSDRGSVDVSGLDSVLSPRPCQTANSSGQVTMSLSNPLLEQQTHDEVPLAISDRDVPILVPENSHAMGDSHNDIEPLTNYLLMGKSTTSDPQEKAPETITESSLETPVSRSVNVMDPPEQVEQLSSESSTDHNSSREMQCSSEQAELVSSPVPINQYNHVSLFMKPLEQVQQLRSAELPSSHLDSTNFPLATEVELQPTVVPNQDVTQRGSDSELDSLSHEVVHPASNSDHDFLTPGEVRTQSSDPRNLSTPSETNYHPMQTDTHSASRMLLHLRYDPLKNELDRIRKVTEHTMKNYEDMKLQLKFDFEKELEELRVKYDIKFQEIEVEFQHTKRTLDTSLDIVRMNKLLADAFRSKCLVLKSSGTSDSSYAQQLFQLPRQQSATCPPLVAGSSSCGPSATSLQSPYTTANSQHMVPPIQAGYSVLEVFSNGEIHAPAPHPPSCRPSTSVPASSVPALLHGMPSQTDTVNVPATSPSFSHGPPRPKPTTYPSDPHLGCPPGSAGRLPTPNLPAMDLRMNANSQFTVNLPNVAVGNLSRFGTSSSALANASHQSASPDLVCLSDDD